MRGASQCLSDLAAPAPPRQRVDGVVPVDRGDARTSSGAEGLRARAIAMERVEMGCKGLRRVWIADEPVHAVVDELQHAARVGGGEHRLAGLERLDGDVAVV